MPHVCYASYSNIDQLYRRKFGDPDKVIEKTERKELRGNIGLKSKLSTIIELVSGANIEAQGTIEGAKQYSETQRQKTTKEGVILETADIIFDSDEIHDVNNIPVNNYSELYSFELEMQVQNQSAEKPVSGEGAIIEHRSDELMLKGFTSHKNWSSPSLLTGLMNSNDATKFSGALQPLSVSNQDGTKTVQANFLFLCIEYSGL